MEAIVLTTAKDLVVEELREAIYTGQLRAGQELIQHEISEQLGVSRMPVREAFLILQSAGLIEVQKNKRAIVKSFSQDNVSEHLEIRTLLECRAAEKACKRAPNFDELFTVQEKMEHCNEEKEFRILNRDFHFILWSMAKSPKLEDMLKQLWFSMPSVYPKDFRKNLQRNIKEHAAILKGLQLRDAKKTAKAVAEHVNQSKQMVISRLEEDDNI